MDYKFKFIKNRDNVEKFRVNVRDPANGNSVIDPSTPSKIELKVGTVIISTETNEITWVGDVIHIKPSTENFELLSKRSHSELIFYNGANSTSIASGFVVAISYD